MIDLDDQLTAYSRYLDDLERPFVADDAPGSVDRSGRTSRRRFLSMSAAAAVAIAGGAAITRVVTRGDSSRSTTPAAPEPDWQLVADPDGLFLPAPPEYEERPGSQPNVVEITAVADTSHGLLAVGREMRDLITHNAMWRSDDGVTWERLAPDEDFGTTEFTGAAARTLAAVTERDGRLIGAGDAALWWTDDLDHWESVTPPRPSGGYAGAHARSVCAGPAGFVAAGVGLWFSPDGSEWRSIDRYARVAVVLPGGTAFVDGSFVVATSLSGGPHVVMSSDGHTWADRALPGDDTDAPLLVCGHDDTLVVLGAASWYRAQARSLAWWSNDRGATWTRSTLGGEGENPSVLVHVGGEFVAVVTRSGDDGATNVQYRSVDGREWTEYPVDLAGYRWATTAFGDGAVAVGSQGWMIGMEGPVTSVPTAEEIARDPRNASSIWTLGL